MSEITLLDGGMGQELIHRSGNPASPLWSTQVMIDKPGLVAEIHRDYAKAGATVATTNTYAIHRDRLRGGESNHYAADGIETADLEDQFEALLNAAVDEADAVKGSGRIAGSIGPLKASYRPDLHPEPSIAVSTFAEIAKLLAPRVDIILFETVPSISAARDALVAGRQTDKPVWIALTIDDEDGSRLRSGERLVDVVPIVRDADAALINCCAPEIVSTGLDCLQAAGVPLGAYANGFETLTKDFIQGGTTADVLKPRRDLTPEIYADYAMAWLDHGATIIGGCCEVGPAHIAAIEHRLRTAGHNIV